MLLNGLLQNIFIVIVSGIGFIVIVGVGVVVGSYLVGVMQIVMLQLLLLVVFGVLIVFGIGMMMLLFGSQLFIVDVNGINNMLFGIVVVINIVIGNLGIVVLVVNGSDGVYFVFSLMLIGVVNMIGVVFSNVVGDNGLFSFGVMLMFSMMGGQLMIMFVNGSVVWKQSIVVQDVVFMINGIVGISVSNIVMSVIIGVMLNLISVVVGVMQL